MRSVLTVLLGVSMSAWAQPESRLSVSVQVQPSCGILQEDGRVLARCSQQEPRILESRSQEVAGVPAQVVEVLF